MPTVMIAYIAAALFGVSYTCWLCYLVTTNLYRARLEGKLTITAFILSLPVIIVGVTCDFIVNIVLATVVLLELPRELLLTTRLSRHFAEGSGWRYRIACWFGTNLLNPFDHSGNHLG